MAVPEAPRAARIWEKLEVGPYAGLLGHWIPIALSTDVGTRAPTGVRRFGLDLVLWRDGDGVVRCGLDECPHRSVALSQGRLSDGRVVCPLHALEFSPDGSCHAAPCEGTGYRIPKAMRMVMFDVHEVHDFVWVWLDRTRPNPADIPWFHEADPTANDVTTRTYLWPVTYERMVENTFDLAHFPVVHEKVLGLPGPRIDVHEVRGSYPSMRIDFSFAKERGGEVAGGQRMRLDIEYPCLAMSKVMEKAVYLVGTTPVDDDHCWFFSRVYQHYCRWPLAGRAISALLVEFERFLVLPDDLRVMRHQPKRDVERSELYLPSDVAIAKWYQHRNRLAQARRDGRRRTLDQSPLDAR